MSSVHDRLAGLIRSARSVVALTGAGVSVPSGIPDFRSPGTGLWANVDPMEVAHISVWRRDPERFWGFYGRRFATLEGKQPNGAHAALAELGIPVITQNIDGLHGKAGSRDEDRCAAHGEAPLLAGVETDGCSIARRLTFHLPRLLVLNAREQLRAGIDAHRWLERNRFRRLAGKPGAEQLRGSVRGAQREYGAAHDGGVPG